MPNLVEIILRTRNETRDGLREAELEARVSGDRIGGIFDKVGERLKTSLGNVGKGLGAFAGGSGLLAMAGPLGAAGAALGAFGAVAVPELSKVRDAMSQTGTAGQKAWAQLTPEERNLGARLKDVSAAFQQVQAALAPVVDTVASFAAGLATDLLPALSTLATAGGKVLDAFLVPFDKFAQSAAFKKIIDQFAQFAVQVGNLAGPQLVQLLQLLLNLFVQLMPSGVQILGVLLPLIVQLVGDLTPAIVVLAKIVAATLQWLAANHLLIPALGALAVAILLAMDTTPIGLLLTAIALLVAAVVELARRWHVGMTQIREVVSAVVGWIRANWKTLAVILMGPIGLAVIFIVSHFRQIVSTVRSVVGAVRAAWSAVYGAIVGPVASAVGAAEGMIQRLLSMIGLAHNNASQVMGQSNLSLGTGPRFGLAHGGITGAAAGGPRSNLTMVGEHGRELVRLPAGSTVHSNPDTERMLGRGGGGGQVTVYFDFGGGQDELVRVLRKAIRVKGGDVQTVLGT